MKKGDRNDRAAPKYVVTDGSGDVFADLGIELTREERLKIAIAKKITEIIARAGYTQERVASLIGTDQAKVSNLTRGKLAGFSIERLIGYLLALGVDIKVDFSKPHEGRTGRIRVYG